MFFSDSAVCFCLFPVSLTEETSTYFGHVMHTVYMFVYRFLFLYDAVHTCLRTLMMMPSGLKVLC